MLRRRTRTSLFSIMPLNTTVRPVAVHIGSSTKDGDWAADLVPPNLQDTQLDPIQSIMLENGFEHLDMSLSAAVRNADAILQHLETFDTNQLTYDSRNS